MRNYQTILFDMDGTLVDSRKFHSDVIYRFFAENGVAADYEVVSRSVGKSVTDVLNASNIPKDKHRDFASRLNASYDSMVSFEKIGLIEGVPEMLRVLRAEGYEMWLVTNSMSRLVEGILKWFDLAAYFDVVLAAEADAPDKKTRCKELIAGRSIPKEQILFVGDSESDVDCADVCGVDICIVLSKYAWAANRQKIVDTQKIRVISDIRELPDVLRVIK